MPKNQVNLAYTLLGLQSVTAIVATFLAVEAGINYFQIETDGQKMVTDLKEARRERHANFFSLPLDGNRHALTERDIRATISFDSETIIGVGNEYTPKSMWGPYSTSVNPVFYRVNNGAAVAVSAEWAKANLNAEQKMQLVTNVGHVRTLAHPFDINPFPNLVAATLGIKPPEKSKIDEPEHKTGLNFPVSFTTNSHPKPEREMGSR